MSLLSRIRHMSDGDTVDVRDSASTPAAPAATKMHAFGSPVRCPECSGRGYLDHLDLVDRIQYEHCTVCGHTWTITEAEILELS